MQNFRQTMFSYVCIKHLDQLKISLQQDSKKKYCIVPFPLLTVTISYKPACSFLKKISPTMAIFKLQI